MRKEQRVGSKEERKQEEGTVRGESRTGPAKEQRGMIKEQEETGKLRGLSA
jgi:hypothetical protein